MVTAFKNLAYGVLDLATFRKGIVRRINEKIIRFPPRWSRYYEDYYEAANYNFLREYVKPGMEIVDIGAHIGLFSVYTSQLTGSNGRVICFEPTPGTFSILKRTLALNHCKNVTAVQAAVSSQDGDATFYVSDMAGCNSNSLVKNKPEKEISGYAVKLVTIDTIVSTYSLKPSLVKIDAEGAELDVLKGGRQTFSSLKPVIILGLHPAFIKQKGDSLEEIWNLLQDLQYSLKMDGKKMSKEDFCDRQLLFDVHCF
jgi:FkbM family methyltransferase